MGQSDPSKIFWCWIYKTRTKPINNYPIEFFFIDHAFQQNETSINFSFSSFLKAHDEIKPDFSHVEILFLRGWRLKSLSKRETKLKRFGQWLHHIIDNKSKKFYRIFIDFIWNIVSQLILQNSKWNSSCRIEINKSNYELKENMDMASEIWNILLN